MSITLNDIQKAKERIAPYITETPLQRLHSLDAYLGCQVYAKAECHPRTGRRNCPVRDVPAFSDRPGALPGAGCGHGAAL